MAHFQTSNYFIVLGPVSKIFLELYPYELSLPRLIQRKNHNYKKYSKQERVSH